MDLNKMMAQAKKMQAEIEKREKEFDQRIFDFERQGIKLQIKGSLEIVLLDIDEVLIDPEDKETLQDLITITINEAIQDVFNKKNQIKSSAAQGLI